METTIVKPLSIESDSNTTKSETFKKEKNRKVSVTEFKALNPNVIVERAKKVTKLFEELNNNSLLFMKDISKKIGVTDTDIRYIRERIDDGKLKKIISQDIFENLEKNIKMFYENKTTRKIKFSKAQGSRMDISIISGLEIPTKQQSRKRKNSKYEFLIKLEKGECAKISFNKGKDNTREINNLRVGASQYLKAIKFNNYNIVCRKIDENTIGFWREEKK